MERSRVWDVVYSAVGDVDQSGCHVSSRPAVALRRGSHDKEGDDVGPGRCSSGAGQAIRPRNGTTPMRVVVVSRARLYREGLMLVLGQIEPGPVPPGSGVRAHIPYRPGVVLFTEREYWHRIGPSTCRAGDRRLTLQGHGVRLRGEGLLLFW